MAVNMDYKAFRATMTEQRRRLRAMVDKVEDDLYESIRDVYLPQFVQDVLTIIPMSTGKLAEGFTYKLNRTKRRQISLTVSAKAYHKGYNYAYIQHERTDYSHEDIRSDHYISIPFERMIRDIADMEGFDYVGPSDESRVFGEGGAERMDDF